MSEPLSQSDLDALFGDAKPAKSEDNALSQSDLDALFGDLVPGENTGVEGTGSVTDAPEALDLSQPGQEPQQEAPAGGPSGSETMSQDEIDALLAEFLG